VTGRGALVGNSRDGIAVTVAAVVTVAVVVGVIPTPDLAAALSDATDALGPWTYVAVSGLAFLETAAFVGLAVPGETAVVVGGVAAARGDVSLAPMIGLVWLGAVGGDLVSFALGRRLGRPFLHTHGPRLGIGPDRVARVEDWFVRWGGRAVLVGRFVGVLRALTPFLAGESLLPLRRFLPYSVVGGLAWATTFTLVGYGFASSFESAGETATRIALGAAVLIGLALVLAPRLRRPRPGSGQEPHNEVKRRHGGEVADRNSVPELLVLVNAHASGVADPKQTARDLVEVLEELGASAISAVTSTEPGLWDCLGAAAERGYRVALVGGDGALHAAANAPLATLPELAIIPAGRANNIARALGIPSERTGALHTAAFATARPLDALLVRTPQRSLYALEAVSAGFQADARASYGGENSSDLRQGVRALVGALRRYKPYRIRARVDGSELGSSSAAQLFLSNLRYFGYGFDVAPDADPSDGRFDAILIDAPGRLSLVRLLAATRRGRHLTRPGVRRVSGRRAELTEPLPLAADAVPLGTTTATVSVQRARLRVASPGPGGVA
jgi:membrane-associated protein